MGMFDTVEFECPSCGCHIEVQSKAGACDMLRYDETAVPPNIAGDIINEVVTCDGHDGNGCGKHWRVRSLVPIPESVPMGLVAEP